jgi:predicted nucleic acid-binding protein
LLVFIDTGYLVALVDENDQYARLVREIATQFETRNYLKPITSNSCIEEAFSRLVGTNKQYEMEKLRNAIFSSKYFLVEYQKESIVEEAQKIMSQYSPRFTLVDSETICIMKKRLTNYIISFDGQFDNFVLPLAKGKQFKIFRIMDAESFLSYIQ